MTTSDDAGISLDAAPATEVQRQALANAVLARMLEADAYSRWLAIETLHASPGRSTLRMIVRPEMVNGFGISHGGIVYGLADSAFAFAVNSHGDIAVAVDCTMSYPAAVMVGDTLTATAVEQSTTRRLAFCEVTVRNQHDVIVGFFRGTAFRTGKPHFADRTA
jgi:acyl-CoA thioesterase